MPTVHCPGCDEGMDIEADWYGRRVACPTCDRQFTARRPGARDDDEEPAPRRSRRQYDDEVDDRPPRRERRARPPEGMSRGGRQLMVLGIIGGVLLLVCGGCGLFGYLTIFAPVDYSGPWVAQSLPDGSYTMQFPKTPTSETLGGGPFSGASGNKYSVIETLPKDAAFVFGVIDADGMSFDTAWQAEIDEIKRQTKAKVTRETPINSAGLIGKEAIFSAGGASVTYRLLDASANGRNRYLVMAAGGRNVSDADRKKFLDSLKSNR